jgi:hypothetical protein
VIVGFTDTWHFSLYKKHMVQVKCESGEKVFLDGAYKGKTRQEQRGTLLQGISLGQHLLSFQKDGYEA